MKAADGVRDPKVRILVPQKFGPEYTTTCGKIYSEAAYPARNIRLGLSNETDLTFSKALAIHSQQLRWVMNLSHEVPCGFLTVPELERYSACRLQEIQAEYLENRMLERNSSSDHAMMSKKKDYVLM